MADGEGLEQEIRRLEERLLQPEVRSSGEELMWLLADDFVEIGSSGPTYNKQQIVDRLPSETHAQWLVDDFQVRVLSPDVALATYRVGRYPRPGDVGSHSLRSSIWTFRDERWQMTFHRERWQRRSNASNTGLCGSWRFCYNASGLGFR